MAADDHHQDTVAAAAAKQDELDEWAKKDNRRFLQAAFRVGNLDRSIGFYQECLGMKVLRKRDYPEKNYSKATVGYGPQDSHFVLELICNYGVDQYDIGTGFGHFAIATPNVYERVEIARSHGGKISKEAVEVFGGLIIYAFVEDPDGYTFELLQRKSTPQPICQVMLRVADLDRSINFYHKALGMKQAMKVDVPQDKFTIGMMGYGEEHETTVFELVYVYGVTQHTKGNGYAQVSISTDDVYKSAAVVEVVCQEFGGKITRPPGPIPGTNTKIAAFIDPDGWEVVLVDNKDFLTELAN